MDYPAAHSMDTTWFAVDADGNIGIFDTYEGGAIPKPAYPHDIPDFEEHLGALVLHALRIQAEVDPEIAAVLPDNPEALRSLAFDLLWSDYLPLLGIWAYECPQQWPAPYNLASPPALPVLLRDLPEQLRDVLSYRLPVRFREHDRLQPLQYDECWTWNADPTWFTESGEFFPSLTRKASDFPEGTGAEIAQHRAGELPNRAEFLAWVQKVVGRGP